MMGAPQMLREGFQTLAAKNHPASRPVGVDQRLILMHQAMLGDTVRLDAYDRAFAEVIRRGDVVIDVGAGLLVLSLLALRHGAAHVYAIEGDPQTALMAREIAQRNKLTRQLTIIEGDARKIVLAKRADVIVSEMMGNLGPEEEMAEIIEVVARQNLRPGGRIVPQRLATKLVAVQFDHEGWGVWRQDFHGYLLDSVQEWMPSTAQLHFFSRPPLLLSAPAVVADARLGAANGPIRRIAHRLTITGKGRLQAVAGYFEAMLSPSQALSNFPSYPGCNWASWVWPLRHTEVLPDDVIEASIHCPAQPRLATDWRLDCRIARTGKRP